MTPLSSFGISGGPAAATHIRNPTPLTGCWELAKSFRPSCVIAGGCHYPYGSPVMILEPRPTLQCASKRFLRRILRECAVEAKQIGGAQNGAYSA